MAFKHPIRTHRAFVCIAFLLALAFATAGPVRAAPLGIVGLGDSLMAGYGLAPGEAFTERLEAVLKEKGRDVTVANAGVSGDTSSGGLSRLDWSVPDGTALVLLELGSNDMLRGIAPELTEKNLDAMLRRLKERGIPVVLIGMLAAPNLGSDYQQAFDAIYPQLAEKYGVPLYPFFLDGVVTVAGMQLEDGMHPSAAGIEKMVAGILPLVEAELDRIAGRD